MDINDVLKATNWKLLREQKLQLLGLIVVNEDDERVVDALDGIINFIDAIQDAAVDSGIKTGDEVFGDLS